MRSKLFFLTLALVITGAASVNAQVLIGERANGNPHAGAILDLAPTNGQNLGLLLPNVQLTNDASKFVLVPEGTVDDGIKQTATGMLVYNTEHVLFGEGLYIWNGASWMSLNKNPCPAIVEDLDGNTYFVGNFDTAGCWMTQNLRFIGELEENNFPEGGSTTCYAYPNDDPSILDDENHPEYGLLYNWLTATKGENTTQTNQGTADYDDNYKQLQGICPGGWHIPSNKEWEELVNVINADDTSYSFESVINEPGTKMKSQIAVNGTETYGKSNTAVNGGFDALLVGGLVNGEVSGFGSRANFWANSTFNGGFKYSRALTPGNSGSGWIPVGYNEMDSVRCKKDN
ncbi:MAG: fibrobacter succinogenes major paralogous domain-containing protein [Dysgonamonadaceae bacterium]|jgi:uncharacterized protein (TIGR02145 family)|nr:fibrobacter succinogenes major paralogous domain-containing protein [Dysgonamonadaceae bacterium]